MQQVIHQAPGYAVAGALHKLKRGHLRWMAAILGDDRCIMHVSGDESCVLCSKDFLATASKIQYMIMCVRVKSTLRRTMYRIRSVTRNSGGSACLER